MPEDQNATPGAPTALALPAASRRILPGNLPTLRVSRSTGQEHRPHSKTGRIAIFCPLHDLGPAYSLSEVIVEQAKMLALAGHGVEIWTVKGFDVTAGPAGAEAKALVREYPQVSLRACIPQVVLYDWQATDKTPDMEVVALEHDTNPTFEGKVSELVEGLKGPASQVEYVFAHDLCFQTSYLAHGIACRRLADLLPDLKWLHWQHSGPSLTIPDPLPNWPHRSRFEGMPNSRWVFVNDTVIDRQLVARNRGVREQEIAFVPNTRDVMEYFDFDKETKRFVRENDLLSAELLIVVPARLNGGKQPKKAMMVTKAFRDCGRDARLVWVSGFSPVAQDANRNYLASLREFGREIDLAPEHFLVTNEHAGGVWDQYTPRRNVRELQQLADLFVLPSLSEAHSLVTMEAALCRQTLILNADFPAMAEWLPRSSTVNWHFGSVRVEELQYSKPGDPEADPVECEMAYYRQCAWALLDELGRNRAWLAFSEQKRHRSLAYVYKRYVAPVMRSLLPASPPGK